MRILSVVFLSWMLGSITLEILGIENNIFMFLIYFGYVFSLQILFRIDEKKGGKL